MKLGRIIGLVLVIGTLLFLTATYVQYSNYAELLKDRGCWAVDVSGGVYLTGGSIYATIDQFRAQYDSSPEIPTFGQFLTDKFGSGEKQQAIPENDTFVKLRVVVTVKGDNGYDAVLLDKTTNVPYTWAGGSIGQNGLIGSYDYSLGPYVAYYEFSPLKITTKVLVDGSQKAIQTFYLSIPEPESQIASEAFNECP
jgi:hypothetical protein